MEDQNITSYKELLSEISEILNICGWNGKIHGKNYKKHPDDILYQALLNKSISLIKKTIGIQNAQYRELIDNLAHDASSVRGWFLADIYIVLKEAFNVYGKIYGLDNRINKLITKIKNLKEKVNEFSFETMDSTDFLKWLPDFYNILEKHTFYRKNYNYLQFYNNQILNILTKVY